MTTKTFEKMKPFGVEFKMFEEFMPISREQRELLLKLIYDDLRTMFKRIFDGDPNCKFLDRCEACVSSFDEKKQLRLDMKRTTFGLCFHQCHSGSKEYFTIDELRYISTKIKYGLDSYLLYDIGNPVVYAEFYV